MSEQPSDYNPEPVQEPVYYEYTEMMKILNALHEILQGKSDYYLKHLVKKIFRKNAGTNFKLSLQELIYGADSIVKLLGLEGKSLDLETLVLIFKEINTNGDYYITYKEAVTGLKMFRD